MATRDRAEPPATSAPTNSFPESRGHGSPGTTRLTADQQPAREGGATTLAGGLRITRLRASRRTLNSTADDTYGEPPPTARRLRDDFTAAPVGLSPSGSARNDRRARSLAPSRRRARR